MVQAECLANIQGANKYEKHDIQAEGDGKFHITERKGDKAVKTVLVNIPGGSCGCSYFQKSLIPCRHMFAISVTFHLIGPGFHQIDKVSTNWQTSCNVIASRNAS